MRADCHSEYPLVSTDFQVWELRDQLIQEDGWRAWRTGVRLGPNTTGAGANYAASVESAPTAMRKTTARGMLTSLQPPGQVGSAPTIDTDASSGFLRLALQIASTAMNLCEAEEFALVRLAGATSRAHPGSKTDVVKGATVGYCPCCARATNRALPPTYAPC